MLDYHTKEKNSAMKTASTEPHTVDVFPATTRKGAQNSVRETSSFLLHARYDCALSPTPVSTKSLRVMSQQACRKVSEALLSGPASTALFQLAQLRCDPCAVVNPRTRGVCDKPPTRLRISSGINVPGLGSSISDNDRHYLTQPA